MGALAKLPVGSKVKSFASSKTLVDLKLNVSLEVLRPSFITAFLLESDELDPWPLKWIILPSGVVDSK